MPMTVINFLARRGLAAAVLVVAGCLLVAGCGGSGPTQTFPDGVRPIGPANLAVNLKGLMAANQSELKHVKADCPSGPITHFPVRCRFTATQIAPLPGSSKRVRQSFPGPYRVDGTITVLGVYFRTRTYEYALDYVPTH